SALGFQEHDIFVEAFSNGEYIRADYNIVLETGSTPHAFSYLSNGVLNPPLRTGSSLDEFDSPLPLFHDLQQIVVLGLPTLSQHLPGGAPVFWPNIIHF
ncbi:MAG: hypothetical protein V4484_21665, partial [Pseudomonadota bacterium]